MSRDLATRSLLPTYADQAKPRNWSSIGAPVSRLAKVRAMASDQAFRLDVPGWLGP